MSLIMGFRKYLKKIENDFSRKGLYKIELLNASSIMVAAGRGRLC